MVINVEYKISKAKYEDGEKIYNYLLKIDNEFPVKLSQKVNLIDYNEKLLKNGIVLVAKDKDIIIGILGGYINDFNGKEAYISILEIEKEYRKLGIACNLIKEFEKMANENNMKKIRLYTHKDNETAKRFYKKMGFKIKENEQANYGYSIVLEKDIKSDINILLTSVGRRGYLVKYFKEAIGNGKVHVSNSSDISPAFNYADASVVTPLIYDDNYIDFLLDYCNKNSINAIISLFDIDLPILSKNKKRFEANGIKVIVSALEVIEICNDKWKTYKFLKENGFNTVHTYINVEEAIQDLNSKKINYPVIIKPRWGMGSLSVMTADNEDELNTLYKKAINNIKNTYLKYESSENIKQAVIIQEKIVGQEYGLDVINDLDGNYKTTIVKQKYAMRFGETDCAKVINNKPLKELGRKMAEKLKHIANMDVDVFLVNNKPYVLEMNARFGGGYPFSHMSGVNLPKAIIAWLRNEKIDEDVLKEKKIERLFHKDINIIELKENL